MHYAKISSPKGGKLYRFRKVLSKKNIVLFTFILILSFGVWLFLNRNTNSTAKFILQNIPVIDSTPTRMNILLLGNAGGRHDGASLTDTIMVAAIDFESKRINLISLPRDLWIDDTKTKINAVYEVGKSQGSALDFSKQKIGEVLGIPLHHAIRIDFAGFTQAVDEMGGIDVSVEKSFDDYLYPITGHENDLCENTEQEIDFNAEEAKKLNIEPGKRKVLVDVSGVIATDSAQEDKGYKYFGCRYEHLSFKAGKTHMDGQTALKFVRSRHGTGGEGSDFARASRQQKVIEAVRVKALSLDTLINPTKITGVLNALGKTIETDLSISDVIELSGYVKKINTTNSYVLGGQGGDSLLVHPVVGSYGGAWVLVPKGDNFQIIQSYVQDILNGEVVIKEKGLGGKKNESSPSAWPRNGGL